MVKDVLAAPNKSQGKLHFEITKTTTPTRRLKRDRRRQQTESDASFDLEFRPAEYCADNEAAMLSVPGSATFSSQFLALACWGRFLSVT